MIPYGRQWIDEDDIQAVVDVLRSDWLTTGPRVAEFEEAFAGYTGAKYAVAVSSGTAALHAAMFALDIGPGDEVIVPPITFAATANCVVYQGGTPVFADVTPDNLLIDPEQVRKKITPKTKAIIAVDYAGQPCDYDSLRTLADKNGLALVADSCHSVGGKYKGRKVGTLADMSAFSFHPVKHITTGEGGMITTDNPEYAYRMKRFRNHGISVDFTERAAKGTWFYEMLDLGYNYRITDIQCALGMSQLKKLDGWIKRRWEIAATYDEALMGIDKLSPLSVSPDVDHAYHLYVIMLADDCENMDRKTLFEGLRAKGIGVNVHYIPVHLHPFYQKLLGETIGVCPIAEQTYKHITSIPIFQSMKDIEVDRVVSAIAETIAQATKG